MLYQLESLNMDNTKQTNCHLTHAALTIVLQHWMIPNIGWSTKLYECKILSIRNALTNDRLRYEEQQDKAQMEQSRRKFSKLYEEELLYFDEIHRRFLKDALTNEGAAESSLRELKVSIAKHIQSLHAKQ